MTFACKFGRLLEMLTRETTKLLSWLGCCTRAVRANEFIIAHDPWSKIRTSWTMSVRADTFPSSAPPWPSRRRTGSCEPSHNCFWTQKARAASADVLVEVVPLTLRAVLAQGSVFSASDTVGLHDKVLFTQVEDKLFEVVQPQVHLQLVEAQAQQPLVFAVRHARGVLPKTAEELVPQYALPGRVWYVRRLQRLAEGCSERESFAQRCFLSCCALTGALLWQAVAPSCALGQRKLAPVSKPASGPDSSIRCGPGWTLGHTSEVVPLRLRNM